jgi:hypothetical protein
MLNLFFEKMMNRVFKKDIDLLFGKDSTIKVNSMGYSTQHKKFHLSVTLFPSNYDYALEVYPEGLEGVVQDAWKFMAISKDIILTTSIHH